MELSAFTNLFQNLQDYVVGILNSDEILQQMGCTFLAENSLDIEYQIRDALNKQGMACVVMTPKATYQGHNGIQQTFTCDELTVQIVENPIINRARLKKAGLDHGTALDVAKQASDRLAGPQGGYFGQFTTKKIQEAEQGGLLVCTATFGCTVYEKLDAVISGDLSGQWVEVPFVRTSELSDYIDDYLSAHMPAMDGYLPLSGGEMSGDITFQSNNSLFWGDQNYHDAYIMGGSMGLAVYNDADEQWRFKSSYLPESDDDVLRRRDLSGISPDVADGKTYIWNYNGNTPVSAFSFKGTLTKEDIDALALPANTYYCVRVGTDVSAIGDAAFFDARLWEIHLPWTIREIGVSALGASAVRNGVLRYFDIYGRDNQMEYQTTAVSSKQHGFLTIKEFAFANQQNIVQAHFPPYQSINLSTASFYNCQVYMPTMMAHGIFFDDLAAGYKEGQIVQTIASWNSSNWEDIGLLSSDVKAWMPVYYEWLEKQKYGQIPWTHLTEWSYINTLRMSRYSIMPQQYTFIDNLANNYHQMTRSCYFTFFNGTSADVCREAWLDLSVNSEWTNPGVVFQPALSNISALNFDINTFLEAGTRRKYHIFETEPGKLTLERMYEEGGDGGDYLPLSTGTTQTLQIIGGNNSGWEFLDANSNPMLRIDEFGTYSNKRLDIYGELFYQNQALSDYVESKIPSVPTKLSELSNDVGFVVSADVVMRTNASPLSVTVPYDYGFTLQTPNGTPLLKTIDLNRTAIANLSAGDIETGGYVKTYPEASTDPTKLSAWNWIQTRDTGLGTIIQNQHDAILGEVSEDYVAYNWLIQQGYATSAQMNAALSNYLPLSGGYMSGSITWDYGGMGGPQIYGPYTPQELAFTTTYQPDAQKMVFLDFSRIEEAQGQRTIAFVEDIDAVLGDISALIHAT